MKSLKAYLFIILCLLFTSTLFALPTGLYTIDHGNYVSFHWSGDGTQNGWWIDVSAHGNGSSGNWSNSDFYHKPLSPSNGTHETNTFSLYRNWYYTSISNGSAPMSLQQGTRYYWRLFNGSQHIEGPSFVFGNSNHRRWHDANHRHSSLPQHENHCHIRRAYRF